MSPIPGRFVPGSPTLGARSRSSAAIALLLLGGASLPGAASLVGAARVPEAQPVTRYAIDVVLDDGRHTLQGRETVEYTNGTGVVLTELYLHLHANAYSGRHTRFARDRRHLPFFSDPTGAVPDGRRTGSIEVGELTVDGRPAPFHVEETLLRVDLPRPLPPGGSARLRLGFLVRVPDFRHRFGHRDGNYAITAWFPKLAVHDGAGWRTTPLRGIGEFHADVADYRVAITTPREFVVGATGEREDSVVHSDGSRTVWWRAPAVRDFAWVADAAYRVRRSTRNGITVEYFHFERDEAAAERGVELAHDALAFFGALYGPYPYATFRVAESSAIAGGMGIEFPQIVLLGLDLHRTTNVLTVFESTLVHEVAHQWWYGLVGNDETAEAWLDEAFASYATRRFWRETAGAEPTYMRVPRSLGFLSGGTSEARARYAYVNAARLGMDEKIRQPAADFDDTESYRVSVYDKGSLVLDMLEYLLGTPTFDAVLRTYADAFRYRIARGEDFFAVAEAMSGKPLARFFEQWLDTTGTCDYGVDGVSVREEGGAFVSTVVLRREGAIVMPITVRLTLGDGEVVVRHSDGEAPRAELQVRAASPVRRVEVDPDRRLLETDRVNNVFPRRLHRSFNPLAVDEDAYALVHLPYVWYDDGLELGLLLVGGYPPGIVFPAGVERRHGVSLQVAHNLRQDRTSWSASYDSPLEVLGPRAFWGVRGRSRAGREGAALHVRWFGGPHLYRGPYHALEVGLEHDRWGGDEPERYTDIPVEAGTVRQARLTWAYDHLYTDFHPVAGGSYALTVARADGALGSDWSFTTALARAERYQATPFGVLALRAVHATSGGTAPSQELPSLRRHAGFLAPGFEAAVARRLTALQVELRPPLVDGLMALAVGARGARHEGASEGGQWSGEASVGLRLFGNAPYAIQIDVPVFTATEKGSGWRLNGPVVRTGRPFGVRSR